MTRQSKGGAVDHNGVGSAAFDGKALCNGQRARIHTFRLADLRGRLTLRFLQGRNSVGGTSVGGTSEGGTSEGGTSRRDVYITRAGLTQQLAYNGTGGCADYGNGKGR